MGKGRKKLRLDEILLKVGLVSEEQIREALAIQKEKGGKFGSHLLQAGHIDEAGLVRALATQFCCDGVVLSKLEIPDIILKFIPRRLAIARKIVPFDYDLDENVLKIACEDPYDESLLSEIGFVVRGKEIKFFVAAELALNTAIARYYMGKVVRPEDGFVLELPSEPVEEAATILEGEKGPSGVNDGHSPEVQSILIVTDDSEAGTLLKSLLEQDNFHVVITASADEALETLGLHTFHAVFIKDSVCGDYLDLIDRLRKLSPGTIVRYYGSASSLMFDSDSLPAEENLLRKNLELFTYLLNARDRLPCDYTCFLGRYVDRLCRRMEIPYKDRMAIVSAAYVHDVARHYYHLSDQPDREHTSKLTVKLLRSLGYSPVVVAMLRAMYGDLKGRYTKRLPIEILGSNIITAVDMFCNHCSVKERLSLDKLDEIQNILREKVGKLLLLEVVEAFIGLLKDEILKLHTEQNTGQIMLLSRMPDITATVEGRLKHEGFRVISTDSVGQFAQLYERSRPDIIILAPDVEVSYLQSFLAELSLRKISFDNSPTFILKDGVPSTMMLSLFELGIEDVIGTDGSIELLIAKICRIQSRMESRAHHRGILGCDAEKSSGSLKEMNLCDLMQALNKGQRTAKLTVTPTDDGDRQLIAFFGYGALVFARLDNETGEEAIYQAARWTAGTWIIETVKEDDLPDSNIESSDETIQITAAKITAEKPPSPEPVP